MSDNLDKFREYTVSHLEWARTEWSAGLFASGSDRQAESDSLFHSYYAGFNALLVGTSLSVVYANQSEYDYANGYLNSKEYIDPAYSNLRMAGLEFDAAKTAKARALKASKYIAALTQVISIAHYFGRRYELPVLETYYGKLPAISEALLDMPANNDGIE